MDLNVAVKETLFEQTEDLSDHIAQLFRDQSAAESKLGSDRIDRLNVLSQTLKEFVKQLRETKNKTEYLALRDRMLKGNLNPPVERHQSINTFFKDQKVEIKTIENLSDPKKNLENDHNMKRTSNEYNPSSMQQKLPTIKGDSNGRTDPTRDEKKLANVNGTSQLDLEEDLTNNLGSLHTEKSSSIDELKNLNTMIPSLRSTDKVDAWISQNNGLPQGDLRIEEPLKKQPAKSLFSKQINNESNCPITDGTTIQNGLHTSTAKDKLAIPTKTDEVKSKNLASDNFDTSSFVEKDARIFQDDTVEGLKAINEFRRLENKIESSPRPMSKIEASPRQVNMIMASPRPSNQVEASPKRAEPFVPIFHQPRQIEPVDFNALFPVNSSIKNIKKFNPQIIEKIDVEKMKERVKIVHKPAPVIIEAPRPSPIPVQQSQDLKILQAEIKTLKEELKMQKQDHTSSLTNLQKQTLQEKELESLKLKEKYEKMLKDKEAEIKTKMDELMRLKDSQSKNFYDRNKEDYHKQDMNLLKSEMANLNSMVNKLQNLNVS
jgi:hypothetical protein